MQRASGNYSQQREFSPHYSGRGPSASNRSTTPGGSHGRYYDQRTSKASNLSLNKTRRKATPNNRPQPTSYVRGHTHQSGGIYPNSHHGRASTPTHYRGYSGRPDQVRQPYPLMSTNGTKYHAHRQSSGPYHGVNPRVSGTALGRSPGENRASEVAYSRYLASISINQRDPISGVQNPYSGVTTTTTSVEVPQKNSTNPHRERGDQEDQIESSALETPEVGSQFSMNLDQLVSVTITPGLNPIIDATNNPQPLPVMINIKASNSANHSVANRQKIDIVCAVCVNNSKENIDHAKIALKRLLELLSSGDRLSIVYYHNYPKVHMHFKFVNKANMSKIVDSINTIERLGGYGSLESLKCAEELLKSRKSKNRKSCVILLSDQKKDISCPSYHFQHYFKKKKEREDNNSEYAFAAFGFGEDQDPYLFQQMAEKSCGKYYYVSDVSQLTPYLVSCLTMASRIIGCNLKARLQLKPGFLLKSLKLQEVYGSNSEILDGQTAEFDMKQLFVGFNKNLVVVLDPGPIQHLGERSSSETEVVIGELTIWMETIGQSPKILQLTRPVRVNLQPKDRICCVATNAVVRENLTFVNGIRMIELSEKCSEENDHDKGILALEEYYRELEKDRIMRDKILFVRMKRAIGEQWKSLVYDKGIMDNVEQIQMRWLSIKIYCANPCSNASRNPFGDY